MTKATQTKRFTLAALTAVLLTAGTAAVVFAAGSCTTPTPDCPLANCDK
ncbi:porin [Microcoleus sp. Pol10D4]